MMDGGSDVYSPPDQSLSPNSNLCITIEEVSQSSEQLVAAHDRDDDDLPIVGDNNPPDLHDCDGLLDEFAAQSNESDKHLISAHPPAAGMEFDTYDDAYNHYNSYARDLGFAIRVKSSWTKRNSKEKRGAVLCCNCEGFKTVKEPNSSSARRKETRTGCQAMIRLRLIELDRWKIDEVKLEHNHGFDPERAHNSKSHKKTCGSVATKRKPEPPVDVQVRTIKLYRTNNAIDTPNGETSHDQLHSSRRLDLKGGGFRVLQDFFFKAQLTNPNFFYSMDLSDDGGLRNVFWIEARARAAYAHFNDVVVFDTTCLSNAYELPLVAFVGVNHHGDSILLGCGLVSDRSSPETYVWLFRAWLTCMSGRPPQTFVTEHCKSMQSAVSEVFPRAHHRLSLTHVLQCIFQSVVGLVQDSESFRVALNRVVYGYLKVEEFEVAWEGMIVRFGLTDHETVRGLFQDREQWAPVYLKDTFLAGALTFRLGDAAGAPFIFSSYVNQQTSLREFLEGYESFLDRKYTNEALCDAESSKSIPELKTTHPYESQMAKVFTKEIFTRFQEEVSATSSCSGVTQVHSNGSASSTYVVKEREGEKVRDFEVVYETNGAAAASAQVRCFCVCGGFSFNGYQCRHALVLLSHKGLEEIPSHYILQRWRKDVKRLYVADFGSGCVDVTNPVQWYEHLHRRAMQVVEQGMRSKEHCRVAWEAFKESVNRVTEKSS